jgi:hypothetical protein
MDDAEFLRSVEHMIDDATIFAARAGASDGFGVEKACADHGARPKAVKDGASRLGSSTSIR